jgi:putative ABC transport system permease protein
VAFTVQERTHEVGIRMAVGASRGDVLRLVIWQGGRLIGFGFLPGLLMGALITFALPEKAFGAGFNALDPIVGPVVFSIVATAGFLACLVPARKAASLNPMEALRNE